MTTAVRERVREDPAVRRQQIIDEAMRVIGQHGFNGFTIQLLATRCGISNAGLLYYFGSKDQLLIALLGEVERLETLAMAPLTEAARRCVAPAWESRAARLGLLRTIIERFPDRREIGRFTVILQIEAIDPTHPAHGWFQQRRRAAQALFEEMVTGLALDPQVTTRLLYSLMNGLLQQWLHEDRTFDLLAAWDEGVGRLVPREAP